MPVRRLAGFVMMRKKVFDPKQQETDLAGKIGAGLERVSQAFKVLLWDKAKPFGLSPIQIQILIFIAHHSRELSNVSHLAQEFNVTKPTISDAVRVLRQKELIIKDHSSADSRSYTILLSDKGNEIVAQTEDFAQPIYEQINQLDKGEQVELFRLLSKVIYQFNQKGILSVQRTCFACKFYSSSEEGHYCNLLVQPLKEEEIRLDCLEFESKS